MNNRKKRRLAAARNAAVAVAPVLDTNQPRPRSILRVIGHPIHIIAERLHIASDGRIEKKQVRYIVGGFMMVAGSSMAVGATALHVSPVGHIVVDLVAYAIHGCGAVPYITHVVRHFELEG